MKVFKKNVSACKGLLCASVAVNLLLCGGLYVAESRSHVFQRALVNRHIISTPADDKDSPDYWCRTSWTNTIAKLHTDFDIAFFGNSITRGSDFQLEFPDKKIINLGYSGDNILGMQKRIPMIQKSNAKKVFIMAGTNDLGHISLDAYKERYTNLITAIQDSIPGVKLYLQSVIPTNPDMKMGKNCASNTKVQDANKIVEELAKQYGCTYVDLYSLYADENGNLPKEQTRDGVHLYPQCYKKWADKVRPLVYE